MVATRKRTRQQRDEQGGAAVADASPSSSPDDEDDVDSEEDDEVVVSEEFSGPRDGDGRPHGLGAVLVTFRRGRYKGKNMFDGAFSHGVKCGAGEWLFDVGSPSPSRLSGTFVDDALEGQGRYTAADGSYTVGRYTGGVLCGQVHEYSSSNRLLFVGEYRDNVRNGHGVLHSTDGGSYSGQWRDGEFDGDDNVYTYPAASATTFSFRGRWKEGKMAACRLLMDGVAVDAIVYSQDESEIGGPIAQQPMLPDLYEQHCVAVRPSSLGSAAGEGLFARIDLPAGVVVSFYAGVKQSERVTERRHWRHNGNCIALDEAAGVDIDVPPPFDRLSHYRASLGHKANHTFEPHRHNAEYAHFLHPRMGHIKCVKVRDDAPVAAGQELLVTYDYANRGGPTWWQQAKRQHQQRRDSSQ